MLQYQPEFIIDSNGNRTKVLLDYNNYLEIINIIEDKEDSKLIDEVRNEAEISLTDYKRKRNLV
jgi:hypothetical protein